MPLRYTVRLFSSNYTVMIALLLTGNLKTTGSTMPLEISTKMFLYYVNERFRHVFESVMQVFSNGKTTN